MDKESENKGKNEVLEIKNQSGTGSEPFLKVERFRCWFALCHSRELGGLKNGAAGDRLKEAGNINRSLSQLGYETESKMAIMNLDLHEFHPIWWCKKQILVARSIAKAEYRSLASTSAEIPWIQSLLTKLHCTF
ncbi:hypothetical protein CR513_09894, partial [Mucuna pruriens]